MAQARLIDLAMHGGVAAAMVKCWSMHVCLSKQNTRVICTQHSS